MKHYKTPEGKIRAIEPGQEVLVAKDWVELSDAELQLELNPVLSVADTAAEKILEINGKCETAIDALKAGYPDNEIRTWDKQEAEARAYAADANSNVPFIDGLANARGIPLADLVTKIIAKADAFITASSAEIGKRQNLEDQVMAIKAANALPSTDTSYQDDDTARANIQAIIW